MALQNQVRPRIDKLSNLKEKKRKENKKVFNIGNLRNGIYTAVSEIIMKQADRL